MAKASSILGLNARSTLFSYKFNPIEGRKIAASKLKTERVLVKEGVPVPKTFAKFSKPEDVVDFNWDKLPSSFALKPSKGLGGEGIIVVKKRSKDGKAWITTSRKRVTIDDLKIHIQDIQEGAFSIGNVPDVAFVQEFVGRHKTFKKYAYRGTPDIRVIVFNKVPVMSMLRLPTKESGGRANLHQGAIAVGIDIATGITTKAYWRRTHITHKPGTKRKLHGIKIPTWTKILKTAVAASEAVKLGYVGVDIVLHPEKGPMVLEINSQPGLSIQLANMEGLKKRLERIEDLDVRDLEHGVKISKTLFAGKFADRVRAEEGIITVNIFEDVRIKAKDGRRITIPAKVDTGAWRTSIDKTLAKDLGLLKEDNVILKRTVWSSLGKAKRPIVNLVFWLKGRKIKTSAGVADRSKLRKPLIIGRKDLTGFIVNPHEEDNNK